MADLAGGDELLDRPGDILHRHGGIDAMLVEQVDAVGLQPLERGVGDLADMRGPAVDAGRRGRVLEAEFRGDDDLVAERRERLARRPPR